MSYNTAVTGDERLLTLYGCVSQLKGDGAGDGIRTRDINLGKVALYQLSYSRVAELLLSRVPTRLSIFNSLRCSGLP